MNSRPSCGGTASRARTTAPSARSGPRSSRARSPAATAPRPGPRPSPPSRASCAPARFRPETSSPRAWRSPPPTPPNPSPRPRLNQARAKQIQIKTPPFSEAARREAGFLLRLVQEGELIGMPRSRPMPTVGPGCHRAEDSGSGLHLANHPLRR